MNKPTFPCGLVHREMFFNKSLELQKKLFIFVAEAGNVDRETHRFLHITEGNC